MNVRSPLLALGIAALPASALAASLTGSGNSPLAVESQTVKVKVEGAIATTEVEQVFRNDTGQAREAIYDFPLPERATFANLSLWVNGKEVHGEVVSRARAEDIYKDVTGQDVRPEENAERAHELGQRSVNAPPQVFRLRSPADQLLPKRDPGILETSSGRSLRLRVAPVPAHGTERLRVRYIEPATIENGRGRHVYPLAQDGGRGAVAGRLVVDATLSARSGIHGVQCPSHQKSKLDELSPGFAYRLSFDGQSVPLDRDLEVTYELEPRDGPEIDVIAARSGEGPGTALVTITPWLPSTGALAGRDVVFVLDTSRAMGRAHDASREVVSRLLGGLTPSDRFGLVTFDIAARASTKTLVAPSLETKTAAARFLDRAEIGGESDLRGALAQVAKLVRATQKPRPLDVVLVASGDVARSDALVREVEETARRSGTRVFALEYGPGRSPAAPLARLARRTGGTALITQPHPEDKVVKELERSLAVPVLRSPHLKIEGVTLDEVHPSEPPFVLRSGTPVTLAGRYTKPGAGRAVLEGVLPDGRSVTWTLPLELPSQGKHPDVTRLWAQAAADDVELELARPNLGQKTRALFEADLAKVSLAGPILTRATSLLCLESEAMFEDYGIARRNRDRILEEKAAEEDREKELSAEIERRRALEQTQVEPTVAQVERPEIWKGPDFHMGGGLGGGGGGAGEPFLVLLGVVGFVASKKKKSQARAS